MRTLHTLLATTLVLLTTTACFSVDKPIQRKDLDLKLFTQPFKPQTVTPRLFGLLPENDYLQEQVKLTAAQKTRMRQVELQLTRVSTALLQPDVQKELGITPKQTEQIKNLHAEARKKFEAYLAEWKKSHKEKKPTRAELAAVRQRGQEMEEAIENDAPAVLIRAQRERFRKLRGNEIDTAKIFTQKNFRTQGILKLYMRGSFKPQVTRPRVFGLASTCQEIQKDMNLTKEQTDRMWQIETQLVKPASLLRKRDMQGRLTMTKAQVAKVRELEMQRYDVKQAKLQFQRLQEFSRKSNEAAKKRDTELLRKLAEEYKKELEKSQSRRAEFERAAFDVLTDSQKRKFRELMGEPVNPDWIFHPESRPLRGTKRPDV